MAKDTEHLGQILKADTIPNRTDSERCRTKSHKR
jgi:hypothetical protein